MSLHSGWRLAVSVVGALITTLPPYIARHNTLIHAHAKTQAAGKTVPSMADGYVDVMGIVLILAFFAAILLSHALKDEHPWGVFFTSAGIPGMVLSLFGGAQAIN